MNKRILISGIYIVTSLSLLAGSAFAFFDAQALTTSNTFLATTANVTHAITTEENNFGNYR